MPAISVRKLEESVVERLKQRASLNHRSLEGEARHILENAVEDDMAVKRASFLALSDRLRQMTQGRTHTPTEKIIRKDRDRSHRDF